MSDAQLQELLAAAENQIVEAEVYIVRQRKRVAQLQGSGQERQSAREMLARLEDAQARRIERRDRLKKELANAR